MLCRQFSISQTLLSKTISFIRDNNLDTIPNFVYISTPVFLHTGYGYPRVLPGPTILISPMLSHPGLDKNHMYLMHRLYMKSRECCQVMLVFTVIT